MGRINEKTGLFIRNLLLFVQCNDTEYDSHNQHQQHCIAGHSPYTGPCRRRYDNLNVPCLIGLVLLLIGYGTNLQCVTARRQVSYNNPVVQARATPFFMKTVNLP